MPGLAVATAFEARLATWSHIGDCPFVDLETVSDVPKPPFIEIEYPVSSERLLSVGGRGFGLWEETGGARFIITVATFQDGWKPQALGWAEEIRDLFRIPFFDGLEVRAAASPVLDDRNKNGNRYRVPFAITYVHHYFKGSPA